MLFYFFMCEDLPFINTTQKTFKPSEKNVSMLEWIRKYFIPGNFSWSLAAETWDPSCFKKGLLDKQQSVPNTCAILPLKKKILSELNRCVFQIPPKYIKLITPKLLFILAWCSFNFYFKITWPPIPQQYNPLPLTKINISDPPTPPAKTFLKFLTPYPPSWSRRAAYPERSIKTKSLNTKPCPSGISPRIICQAFPFLRKLSPNCCTHQVWTVPPSPEPFWVILGMGKNPTQQPKIYSFPHSEKSPLIDLNYSLSKFLFLPHQTAIFK